MEEQERASKVRRREVAGERTRQAQDLGPARTTDERAATRIVERDRERISGEQERARRERVRRYMAERGNRPGGPADTSVQYAGPSSTRRESPGLSTMTSGGPMGSSLSREGAVASLERDVWRAYVDAGYRVDTSVEDGLRKLEDARRASGQSLRELRVAQGLEPMKPSGEILSGLTSTVLGPYLGSRLADVVDRGLGGKGAPVKQDFDPLWDTIDVAGVLPFGKAARAAGLISQVSGLTRAIDRGLDVTDGMRTLRMGDAAIELPAAKSLIGRVAESAAEAARPVTSYVPGVMTPEQKFGREVARILGTKAKASAATGSRLGRYQRWMSVDEGAAVRFLAEHGGGDAEELTRRVGFHRDLAERAREAAAAATDAKVAREQARTAVRQSIIADGFEGARELVEHGPDGWRLSDGASKSLREVWDLYKRAGKGREEILRRLGLATDEGLAARVDAPGRVVRGARWEEPGVDEFVARLREVERDDESIVKKLVNKRVRPTDRENLGTILKVDLAKGQALVHFKNQQHGWEAEKWFPLSELKATRRWKVDKDTFLQPALLEPVSGSRTVQATRTEAQAARLIKAIEKQRDDLLGKLTDLPPGWRKTLGKRNAMKARLQRAGLSEADAEAKTAAKFGALPRVAAEREADRVIGEFLDRATKGPRESWAAPVREFVDNLDRLRALRGGLDDLAEIRKGRIPEGADDLDVTFGTVAREAGREPTDAEIAKALGTRTVTEAVRESPVSVGEVYAQYRREFPAGVNGHPSSWTRAIKSFNGGRRQRVTLRAVDMSLVHPFTAQLMLSGYFNLNPVGAMADQVILATRMDVAKSLREIAEKAGTEIPKSADDIAVVVGAEKAGRTIPESMRRLWERMDMVAERGKVNLSELENVQPTELRKTLEELFPDRVDGKSTRQAAEELLDLGADAEPIPGIKWVSPGFAEKAGIIGQPIPVLNKLNLESWRRWDRAARKGRAVGAVAVGSVDLANDVNKALVLYLNPAYGPVQLLGNVGMNLIQQGVFMPRNLMQAWKIGSRIDEEALQVLDNLMGEGFYKASSKFEALSPMRAAAQAYSRVIDLGPRRAAFLHEARRAGYGDPKRLEALLLAAKHDDKALTTLNAITQRSLAAIVDFDRLNPIERNYITRAIWFYPWLKGATHYSKRFVLDHPYQAATLAWLEYQRRQTKPEGPSYTRYYARVPFTDLVASVSQLHPIYTPMSVGESVVGWARGDRSVPAIVSQFTPMAAAGAHALVGGVDELTGAPINPGPGTFVDEISKSVVNPIVKSRVDKLTRSDEERAADNASGLYRTNRLQDALAIPLGTVIPRGYNRAEGAERLRRQLGEPKGPEAIQHERDLEARFFLDRLPNADAGVKAEVVRLIRARDDLAAAVEEAKDAARDRVKSRSLETIDALAAEAEGYAVYAASVDPELGRIAEEIVGEIRAALEAGDEEAVKRLNRELTNGVDKRVGIADFRGLQQRFPGARDWVRDEVKAGR
ncbi:MAG: hypothetical protein R3C15_19710 [Thermoleophilia bacterium]